MPDPLASLDDRLEAKLGCSLDELYAVAPDAADAALTLITTHRHLVTAEASTAALRARLDSLTGSAHRTDAIFVDALFDIAEQLDNAVTQRDALRSRLTDLLTPPSARTTPRLTR
ncbi:hypothetical protein [Streptomyces silvisoli]|uniref:Uncharacterized protein n=1 Tax=Streptomyces silvisoli TaxID=3034235 RepID=A0ABT5ZPY0_9ACTN|nr:hypothetical protein [Streptomyces silvisoli]MDF3291888.1 hypothetical protein [Streptomyces silvisoli]